MTKDQMISQATVLIDVAYEAGYDEGWENGYRQAKEDNNA
jgi:hypothetical protein